MSRRTPRWAAVLAGLAMLVTACTSGSVSQDQGVSSPEATRPTPSASASSPTETPGPTASSTASLSPTPAPTGANARIRQIPDAQWQRIVEAGVWRPGCPVGQDELRRVEVNHVTFDGSIRRGVLVVNADVAKSVARVFTVLYDGGFPIRQMRPVEAYGGINADSMADDNTAAFNCRRPSEANAPAARSPHANGRAIDINPYENPWVDPRCDCWKPSAKNAERVDRPGRILKRGLVWRTFVAEGWIWQNIDTPDYMHFDTGYPSRALPDGPGA